MVLTLMLTLTDRRNHRCRHAEMPPHEPDPIRLGVLTPSSNTALEPLTSALAAGAAGLQRPLLALQGDRDRAVATQALGQFDDSKILAAAELLADAKVDVIGWSGTSSGWLGFDADRRLCERITRAHRHPGDDRGAGAQRAAGAARHHAARAGHALHRRRAAAHRRQLPRARHRGGGRAPPGHPRQPRLRAGRAASACAR